MVEPTWLNATSVLSDNYWSCRKRGLVSKLGSVKPVGAQLTVDRAFFQTP